MSSSALTAKGRRKAIHDLAVTAGLTSVEQLAVRFDVTPSTIRRDLALLEGEGRLARTYGGAIALTAHPEATLRQRLGEAHAQKSAIGSFAAGLVQNGEVILLDGGSTVGALAAALRDHRDLTVVTCGLNTLHELANVPGVAVESLGGRLRGVSGSLVGPIAEATLERMTFDRVFLGADGVDPERGVNEAGREQTRLKELMARRSDAVYVLADGSKIGRGPFHSWALLDAGWTLVTDDSADPEEVARFEAKGISVSVVPTAASVRKQ